MENMRYYINLVESGGGWQGIKGYERMPVDDRDYLAGAFKDLNELLVLMTDGRPDAVAVEWLADIDMLEFELAGSGKGLRRFTRRWIPDAQEIALGGLTVAEKGLGVGKRILYGTVEVAERLGAILTSEIDNEGSYFWSKGGFEVDVDMMARKNVSLVSQVEWNMSWLDLEEGVVEEIRGLLDDEDARMNWKIADFRGEGRDLGIELLDQCQWYGVFDPRNAEQVARMRGFVG